MNTIDRRDMWLGLGALGLAGTSAHAAIEGRPVGAVTNVLGTCFAERGPDNVSLFVESPVMLEDRVRTGEQSRAIIKLGADTAIRMGAGVRLKIDRFVVASGGILTLESGSVLVDKDDRNRNQRIQLNSPYAMIAIRGTAYWAGLLPDGFGVFVQRGTVAVRAAGAEVLLQPGQGTTIPVVGARPQPVRAWGEDKIRLALSQVS